MVSYSVNEQKRTKHHSKPEENLFFIDFTEMKGIQIFHNYVND